MLHLDRIVPTPTKSFLLLGPRGTGKWPSRSDKIERATTGIKVFCGIADETRLYNLVV